MPATLSLIRTGIGDALRSIAGLRVAEHLPEQINPPLAVVQLDRVDYHQAMVGGLRRWQFVVVVVVGRMGERSAQDHIDRLMDHHGPDSIRESIEKDPTLNDTVWAAKVVGARGIRTISLGDNNYLTVEFEVEVSA